MHVLLVAATTRELDAIPAEAPGPVTRLVTGVGMVATAVHLSRVLAQTSPLHLGPAGSVNGFDPRDPKRFETTPSGNSVNLEDEMLKVAQNQSDYQLAASLYSKGLGLMKIAIGKGR